MGAVRPPLRRHRRGGAAGGSRAGGAVRLPPGHVVARDRRGARGRGAGLHHPVLLAPARRQVARPDGQGRGESGRGRHRDARGAVIGVVLGGAVQDFPILFCSLRRDGKSLGQMAKEEVNPAAGATAMLAVLFIMVILLAVLALIVLNALKASPWGLFTIACTVPIAFLMGWWMKRWRPGRVGEASAAGAALLLGALVAGGWVAGQPHLAPAFTHSATTLTWMMVGYGFIASVLPVWMLLCPRDYLSTFLKITTVLVLGVAIDRKSV